MEEQITLGCLWDGAEQTDYLLCDGDIDALPNLYNQDEIRFEYNQWNQSWSKVSCTIFSAMWMVADLMNYNFSLDELKEVDELSYDAWRMRWKWWYVKSAVDLVCKRWNEKHGDLWKIAYYRVSKHSNMVDEILKKWYTMNTNFCPTTAYWRDYCEDAILDGCDFGTQTNGHAIDIIWNNWKRSVKDSYKWRKTFDGKKETNRYELKHPLNQITNYWPRLYLYTKVAEDNLEEIKRLNELKTAVLNAIEINSKMRHMVNDKEFKNKLHSMNEANRKKLEDIQIQLKKFA